MKSLFRVGIVMIFAMPAHANEEPAAQILAELTAEICRINQKFLPQILQLEAEYLTQKTIFESAPSADGKMAALFKREELRDKIHALKLDSVHEISKVRYLKGVQIIKILYEKILSLDHHFASVRTLGEINRIANPTQYPEYTKLQESVSAKRNKRGFDLTSVLGTNAVISVVQTFTNMMSSSLSREEKEKELAAVECILDFTLRMQNDLNTIYFETAFLHTSNGGMKQEIEVLFRDYAKPIGYTATLESCRSHDDWEALTQKTDEYLAQMKLAHGTAQHKMQVNIEFPIDRLLQYISQYNSFIDQGGKFYEKFRVILNSYENEKQCESRLPPEFIKLRADIEIAIQKFGVAYKPVEINGSKMKEILYGLNEFE